jgi:hypothetical protein
MEIPDEFELTITEHHLDVAIQYVNTHGIFESTKNCVLAVAAKDYVKSIGLDDVTPITGWSVIRFDTVSYRVEQKNFSKVWRLTTQFDDGEYNNIRPLLPMKALFKRFK